MSKRVQTEPDPSRGRPPGRRGRGEWVIITLLVLLIAFVAWKQFGSLFAESEAPGPRPSPEQMQSSDGRRDGDAPDPSNEE